MKQAMDGVRLPKRSDGAAVTRRDPSPDCPKCKGAGVVLSHRWDVDSPQQLVHCSCTVAESIARRRSELIMDARLRTRTFDAFSPDYLPADRVALAAAKRDAMEYAEAPTGWLVLQGPFGAGKTHLAAAIANDLIGRGQVVIFATVPDLLDAIRASQQAGASTDYEGTVGTIREAPTLILDDYGVERATDWAWEKLFQILNHRYNAALPTVITTNLGPDEMDALGPNGRRLRSRIFSQDLSRVVELRMRDGRQQARSGWSRDDGR